MVLSFLMGALKLGAGLMSFSSALVASAVASFADSALNLVKLAGYRPIKKAEVTSHPFMFSQVEYLVKLVLSFAFFLLVLAMFYYAADAFVHPMALAPLGVFTVSVLLLDIAALLYRRYINRKAAEGQEGGKSLVSPVEQLQYDVLASLAVLASLLLDHFAGVHTDFIATFIVSLPLLYASLQCGYEATDPLLNRLPSRELAEKIYDNIRIYPHVKGVHEVVIHLYGPERMFVSAHVEFPDTMPLEKILEEVSEMEDDFLFEGRYLVVHIDLVPEQDEFALHWIPLLTKYLRALDDVSYVTQVRKASGEKGEYFMFFTLHASRRLIETCPQIKREMEEYITGLDRKCIPLILQETLYF